ncbi:MAG: hypothetical protein IB618_00580 [Candidatus Pacearchaeota archaeon]|nr:MAG: hypothetical protein IB618_00580 [Candidatus Pacearchaeota archaeon]
MKSYLIFVFVLLIFLGIFLSGFNGCVSEIEWQKVEEGRWIAINKTCLRENPIDYLCKANCYEKSEAEIWNFCKDEGQVRFTDEGVEVLCFGGSCMPEVKNEICSLICPLG